MRQGPVFLTGLEDTAIPADLTPPRQSRLTLDEGTPGSVFLKVGTTWYDNQQNGTQGKQIAVDAFGNVHHVWTNGEDINSAERHVFYNGFHQQSYSFIYDSTGEQVDPSNRAGYCNVAVTSDGYALSTFHQILNTTAHAAVAIDFLPLTGAFATIEIPHLSGNPEIIWPHADIDIHDHIQLVCTESEGSSLDYYIRGEPTYTEEGYGASVLFPDGWLEWESATFITLDVATSWHTERMAVVWIQDPIGEYDGYNVMLRISEDGGDNWGETIPVTNCPPIDTLCMALGGDDVTCNQDTMRPWIDCDVLLDGNDEVHVAFTASAWYYFDVDGTVGPFGLIYSTIWHWGESTREFNLINEAWFGHSTVALGINNLMTHRPNLAIDTTTGNLYCSYVQFDSVQVSQAGFPSGDAYISMSTDNGNDWSVGTNISNTDGGVDTPTGDCRSERDVFLAKFVTGDTLHVQFMMDLDNGTAILEGAEGAPTENPIYYQKIPTSDIAMTPTWPERPFRFDSTGFPTGTAINDHAELLPQGFALYQNFPNPFNPETKIQFDLQSAGTPELKIYDITGREVQTLLAGQRLGAGAHVVNFDAAGLPSGVYLYRLSLQDQTQTRKMMLIK